MRANWLFLSVMVLSGALVITVSATFERSSFGRGLIVGAGTTFLLGGIGFLVLVVTGTGNAMAGGIAERWTAQELRKLRRDGWHLINHFRLHRTDIDHVLIGPGGVFAIETKWSSETWKLTPVSDRLRNAVGYICGEAHSLELWPELKRAGVETVTPVVFLWGQAGASLRDRAGFDRVSGAVVVAGPRANEFRARLTTGVLSRDQVEAARRSVEQQLTVRDKQDPEPPIPLSVRRLIGVAVATFAVAFVALLLPLRLLSVLNSVAWFAVFVALILLPLIVRHIRVLRYPLLGWWVGLAAAAALAFSAVVCGV